MEKFIANSGAAKLIVSSLNPIAKAFAKRCENIVTIKDKTIKKAKICKNIIDENLILYFDFAYEGIKACVKAPSAKILRNKFGNLNAIKNISE